ncbi:MAG: hypothetical protein ACRYG4_04230 [Janthinobacterium lividum]
MKKDKRPLYSEMPPAAAEVLRKHSEFVDGFTQGMIVSIGQVAGENDAISGAIELAVTVLVRTIDHLATAKNCSLAIAHDLVAQDFMVRWARATVIAEREVEKK